MFTAADKTKIIKRLGTKNYCNPIIDYLTSKKIFNSLDQPYKAESIRKIMDGRENLKVEKAIVAFSIIQERKRAKIKKSIKTNLKG